MKYIKVIIIVIAIVSMIRCKDVQNVLVNTVKVSVSDPFKSTMVPSEFFVINAKEDNVLSGENGTLVVCPKGCFQNSKGEIIDDNVNIELSEALKLDDMLMSNLTTSSNGKPLETDGMMYFNATLNGEQLRINKENPVYIEIPTNEKKAGMMAYKGIRDKNGNMNWVEPKELEKFLVPIDLNVLDFLPQGFQLEVDKGMPYKNYKIATPSLTDSLYYSLSNYLRSFSDAPMEERENRFRITNLNEPYYNKNKKVVNGKYTERSFNYYSDSFETTSLKYSEGIDPAIIKVIKTKKYQNTLIATREFESRLKVIFSTCENEILEIYIKNLSKNLYELDSLAASAVTNEQTKNTFQNFCNQRLTNVKGSSKYSTLLRGYYEKQLLEVKTELNKTKEKLLKIQNRKNNEAQKLVNSYKKLLLKREKFRMEKYGFQWSETGWINVDRGVIPKTWGPQPLEITVKNGDSFDRVHTYVVYTSIKSLYRLNTSDNKLFYVGNNEDREMIMPIRANSVAIAIGYNKKNPYLAIKEFVTGDPKLALFLKPTSALGIKIAIRPYEKYKAENRISKDLLFMENLFKEEQRQKALIREGEFMDALWKVAHPGLLLE
jgi:hypothetical protein